VTAAPIEYVTADMPAPPPRSGLKRELLAGVAVAVIVALSGLPVGLLWSTVAPHAPFVMTPYGPTTVESEPEQFVADDGWYVFLSLGAGLVFAIAVWLLLRQYRGVLVLAGLAIGCAAAGVLMAWLGHHIGLAHYLDLRTHAPVGARFDRPVDVRTKYVGLWYGFLPRVQGAVLVQAVAASSVYCLLAAFHPTPDLDAGEAADAVPAEEPAPAGEVSSG
jgi:hypothetical protein